MANNLYLKTDFGEPNPTDDGTRPYTGATPIWLNTSIFLQGGVSQSQTAVGRPTSVGVRVTNKGGTAIEDVHVDAYVMNPHVGITNPALAVRRLSGFAASVPAGSGGPRAGDRHVINCQLQDPTLGPVDWVPTNAELLASQDGHLCLIANVYGEGDGAGVPDPSSFDIWNNAHQGQRNIALLKQENVANFLLQVLPGPEVGEKVFVQFQPVVGRPDLDVGLNWLLRSRRDVVLEHAGGENRLVLVGHGGVDRVPLRVSHRDLVGELEVSGLGSVGLTERLELPAFGNVGAPPPDAVGFAFEPREVASAVLRLERNEDPGSVQIFDIVQRDGAGTLLGGLRIVSLVGH